MRNLLLAGTAALLISTAGLTQQVADLDFEPPIGEPHFASGSGPRVVIDGAHNNFHTVDGRYQTFAKLLRRDGYRVDGSQTPFSAASLRDVDVLVIANATGPEGATAESAFTTAEVDAVERWVRGGGSLLLIADHEPWPAAASQLSRRFGIEHKNGYAYDGPEGNRQGSLIYRKADHSLAEHEVTEGVQSVADFLGSAFRVNGTHVPLLRMSDRAVVQSAIGPDSGEGEPIGGWLQGALLEAGQGRVAVFAEAAMFSAQVQGPNRRPMGMNAPGAEDNPRFALNVLHWLSRN